MINTKDINEARKQIEKLHKEKKQIIVLAQDDAFNRKMLEHKKVDILLSPERLQTSDKLKQRSSGLNEVLCKIAAKNNKKIGINIDSILKTKNKERALLISKIIQNIKLCRKTKTKIEIFPKNKYDKRDISALLLTLGANTQQTCKM